MEKQIINEELGISNDVLRLGSKIKSSIGDNFSKNYKNKTRFYALNSNFPYKVFHGDLDVKWKDVDINVIYYVVDDADENVVSYYLRRFHSTSDIEKYQLTFYLVGHGDKILWERHNRTIQHEVEHLFQLYKKGKPLLNAKQNQRYHTFQQLMGSSDFIEKIIGYTYYYYTRVEKNALINGIYGDVMGKNINGYVLNPLDEIKNTSVYKNINTIKQVIEDNSQHERLSIGLKPFNKSLDSYLKIANRVVSEYTKAFGRLLYLLKKDIAEANENLLINLSDETIEDYD